MILLSLSMCQAFYKAPRMNGIAFRGRDWGAKAITKTNLL